jgi:hypothetical protein
VPALFRRPAVALAVVSVGVLGLPGEPATPGPAPVHDTPIALGGLGSAAKTDGWSTVVGVPDGTESVALAWDGDTTVEVRLRSRADGGAWSPWVDLHADTAHGEDDRAPLRNVVGPVFVDDADDIEVVVEDGVLAGLTLHALRVDDPPSAGGLFGVAPAGAAVGQPGILSRESWGAAPWVSGRNGCQEVPSTARVRFAVLHHTVTTNAYAPEQTDDEIRSVQYVHQNIEGYCDIAYNFVVDRFGRVWEGRSGGVDRGVVGGHAKGFNTGSFGVVLLGQHHPGASPPAASVSPASRAAVVNLLRWKFAHHGIDARARVAVTSRCDTSTGPCRYPAGQTVVINTIVGHRDVQLTACPGGLAYPIVSQIRSEVADVVNASGPFFPLPGWEPEPADRPAVLTLDAWGGVHPAGSAAAVPAGAFWPLNRFARGIGGTATGGWVVDLHGGLHPYGSAPAVRSPLYRPGSDVARSVAAWQQTGGYILDADGRIHAFAGAPGLQSSGVWPGQELARDIALLPSGFGGWTLDAFGGIHPLGAALPVSGTGYWPGWRIARAIAANPAGVGGWVMDGFGGLHEFGGAPDLSGNRGYRAGVDAFRDLVMISPTGGYAIDTDGVAWPIGDAPVITTQLTSFGARLGLGIVAGS